MKVRLLKKIRSRYEMYYNPNTEMYVMKLKYRWHWSEDWLIDITVYKTKEEMFEVYRKSVISWCGESYGYYPRDRSKPNVSIKHCEK
jgi:hypothetical protein